MGPGSENVAFPSGSVMELVGKVESIAVVELCPWPTLSTTSTPCADSGAKFSGTSGADGTFTFADVPLGNYGLAVEFDGEWKNYWLGSTDGNERCPPSWVGSSIHWLQRLAQEIR